MSARPPIYLDYAATTPVHPEVARAIAEVLTSETDFGNPASATHEFGHRAESLVEAARAQVAALIGADASDIVFTSGATESNNLAILGTARAAAVMSPHIVTTKIEHKAVLDPCKQLEREGFAVTYVTPGSNGVVDPESIRAALRPSTVLVSVMHANNEIGVIQDIRAIGEICRERDIVFHVDGAQAVGKLPVDVRTLPVDLLSFTAHKIYGPKGIGALYVRPSARARLRATTFGGGQERGLRPGTLPTHQIVGFGVACDLAARSLAAEPARLQALRDRMEAALTRIGGVHVNGVDAPRLPGILNVSFEGVEGESLVTSLPSLAVSTGSACSSATGDPSYVLRALGRSVPLAQASLRFSFGRLTTEEEVDVAASAVQTQVERLRALSPAAPPPSAASNPVANPATQPADCTGTAPADEEPRGRLRALSPLARQWFEHPSGGGQLAPGPGIFTGEAGSPAAEAWVRFHLSVEQGSVKIALFQAWGCPHTLATAAWLTGQLPGRSMKDLVPGTPSAWQEAMEVPVEKLGRLLVIEDALKAALQAWNEAL